MELEISLMASSLTPLWSSLGSWTGRSLFENSPHLHYFKSVTIGYIRSKNVSFAYAPRDGWGQGRVKTARTLSPERLPCSHLFSLLVSNPNASPFISPVYHYWADLPDLKGVVNWSRPQRVKSKFPTGWKPNCSFQQALYTLLTLLFPTTLK